MGSESLHKSKPSEEESDITLTETIMKHLGLGHGNKTMENFEMISKERQATIGSRLELILGIVANGALVSLINSILNESDVEDLALAYGEVWQL